MRERDLPCPYFTLQDFFPFKSENSFNCLRTRIVSPLNVGFCVVSGLGSVLSQPIQKPLSKVSSFSALMFLCSPSLC